MVYRLQEAQERSGLTFEQADEKLLQLEAKAAQLEPVMKQLDDRQKELVELSRKRDDLAPVVNNLNERYALLNPRVKDLERREEQLSKRIKEQQDAIDEAEAAQAMLGRQKKELLAAGFSTEALAEFNDRIRGIAARHKILTTALRERLLRELQSLDKGLDMESLVQAEGAELERCRQAVVSARKEHEALKAAIVTLEHQKAALEVSIKVARDKIGDELAHIVPAAKQAIAGFAKELRDGNDGILAELKRTKDQALEIGKQIGRYEGIVEVNEWLVDLLLLARGEDTIEAGRVRVILLQVLRGAHSWMKGSESRVGYIAAAYTTGELIGRLEQWKPK